MEVGNKAIYYGHVHGNILVVGKTECLKTCFLQKLALKFFFGKLVKTVWVTGIKIGDHRKAEIQAWFSSKVVFHLAKTNVKLTELIEKFKLRTRDVVTNKRNSGFGKKVSMDRFFVMDNVSGIADTSKKFAEFLTVCRKYRYDCVFVFPVITPETQIWKKIISQTNIFNVFASSNTVAKFSRVIVDRQLKNIFQPGWCGLTGFLLTLLIQTNVIA